jgi:hypothetical protein
MLLSMASHFPFNASRAVSIIPPMAFWSLPAALSALPSACNLASPVAFADRFLNRSLGRFRGAGDPVLVHVLAPDLLEDERADPDADDQRADGEIKGAGFTVRAFSHILIPSNLCSQTRSELPLH